MCRAMVSGTHVDLAVGQSVERWHKTIIEQWLHIGCTLSMVFARHPTTTPCGYSPHLTDNFSLDKEQICQFMNMPAVTAVTHLKPWFAQAPSLNAQAAIRSIWTNSCPSLQPQAPRPTRHLCPRAPAVPVRTRVVRAGVLLIDNKGNYGFESIS